MLEEKLVWRKDERPEDFVAPTEEELSWPQLSPLGDKIDFFKKKGAFFTAYWAWAKGYGSKIGIGTILDRLFPDMEQGLTEKTMLDALDLLKINEKRPV